MYRRSPTIHSARPLSCMAQPVTRSCCIAGEPEQVAELVGDLLVLAHQDAHVGEVEQVLGDLGGLAALVAGRERVGGLVVGHQLDVAVVAGEPQVGVERLDRLDAEAGLHPGLVAQHDPPVARLGHLAHALAPGVEAHQGDADGGLVAGRVQRLRDSVWIGARQFGWKVDGGVEQPFSVALAQRPEGVAQRPGAVVEVLPGVVAAGVRRARSLGSSRAAQTSGS